MNEATELAEAGPTVRAAAAEALANRTGLAGVEVCPGAGKARDALAAAAQIAAAGRLAEVVGETPAAAAPNADPTRWALAYELNMPTAELARAILAAQGPAGLLDFAAEQCAGVLGDLGHSTPIADVLAAVDALAELARLPGFLNLAAWTPGAPWPGVGIDAFEADTADSGATGAHLLAFLARRVVEAIAAAVRDGQPLDPAAHAHLLAALAEAARIRATLAPYLDRLAAAAPNAGPALVRPRRARPMGPGGRRLAEARRVAALVLRGRYKAACRALLERLAGPLPVLVVTAAPIS